MAAWVISATHGRSVGMHGQDPLRASYTFFLHRQARGSGGGEGGGR
jgi:hypothetical protein